MIIYRLSGNSQGNLYPRECVYNAYQMVSYYESIFGKELKEYDDEDCAWNEENE